MRKIRDENFEKFIKEKNLLTKKKIHSEIKKKLRDFLKREITEEKLRKWKSNLEWKKFPPRSQEKVIFERIFDKKIFGKNWETIRPVRFKIKIFVQKWSYIAYKKYRFLAMEIFRFRPWKFSVSRRNNFFDQNFAEKKSLSFLTVAFNTVTYRVLRALIGWRKLSLRGPNPLDARRGGAQ